MARKKNKSQKCQTPTCGKKTDARYCVSCRVRQLRTRDPILYAYQNLKDNARRRKKEFTLSLEFFRKMCYETDYHVRKGLTKKSYSIDRIDNNKGYTEDNIRVISMEQNRLKGAKKLVYDWENRAGFKVESKNPLSSASVEWFDE